MDSHGLRAKVQGLKVRRVFTLAPLIGLMSAQRNEKNVDTTTLVKLFYNHVVLYIASVKSISGVNGFVYQLNCIGIGHGL